MSFQEITQYERKLYNDGIRYIAGIDEVGRGPLAGPFVVSAVILDLEKVFDKDLWDLLENKEKTQRTKVFTNNDVKYKKAESKEKTNKDERLLYTQIKDSKKVSPKKRSILSDFITKEAISYSVEVFQPEEVDEMGISKLTQIAFFNAVRNLKIKPQYVLTDTFEIHKLTKEQQINIVSGDNKSISIASASIVAKVFRDNLMLGMHKIYPIYGFDRHKGYGTKFHMEALCTHGPCEIHRKSFEPVKTLIKKSL